MKRANADVAVLKAQQAKFLAQVPDALRGPSAMQSPVRLWLKCRVFSVTEAQMFVVGGECPHGERCQIPADSQISRGLHSGADSCCDQEPEQATGSKAVKCRENLHMAKNDKYREKVKIDSKIANIKIRTL